MLVIYKLITYFSYYHNKVISLNLEITTDFATKGIVPGSLVLALSSYFPNKNQVMFNSSVFWTLRQAYKMKHFAKILTS